MKGLHATMPLETRLFYCFYKGFCSRMSGWPVIRQTMFEPGVEKLQLVLSRVWCGFVETATGLVVWTVAFLYVVWVNPCCDASWNRSSLHTVVLGSFLKVDVSWVGKCCSICCHLVMDRPVGGPEVGVGVKIRFRLAEEGQFCGHMWSPLWHVL